MTCREFLNRSPGMRLFLVAQSSDGLGPRRMIGEKTVKAEHLIKFPHLALWGEGAKPRHFFLDPVRLARELDG